jgi:hypothetical protein
MAGFINSIESTDYEHIHNKQKYFLICESCFWCASSLLSNLNPHLVKDERIPKCPTCKNDRIRVIPVLRDYEFK